jgi:hypothetical protein
MATNKERISIESVLCLRCKSEIRQIDLCEVSEGENKKDLQNLRVMEELNDLLQSTIRTSVKEVILHEINVILAKVSSITDVYENKIENDWYWTEVMRRSANLYANKNKQYQ